MSETNRVMTEEEWEAYNKGLREQLEWAMTMAVFYKQNLAADWLKWHIEQMEIEGESDGLV